MGVVAVVQARMGSSRLPGKSLTKIAGLPLLGHVLARLKLSKRITRIIVATTKQPSDDAIVDFSNNYCVDVVRGSSSNVLQRFKDALDGDSCKYIVRVCADSPFIDADVIDRYVDLAISEQTEFVDIHKDTPAIHVGYEVFSRASFDRLITEVPDDPVAMEHVTGYFRKNTDFVSTSYMRFPEEECFTGARISIDTPADLEFVESVYKELHVKAPHMRVKDLVALLKRKPQLLLINAHVHQKGLEEVGHKVVFIEGLWSIESEAIRQRVSLAKIMRNQFAAGIAFIIPQNHLVSGLLLDEKIPSFKYLGGEVPDSTLFYETSPDVVIISTRNSLTEPIAQSCRDYGASIVYWEELDLHDEISVVKEIYKNIDKT